MNRRELNRLLQQLEDGVLTAKEVIAALATHTTVGSVATVDTSRQERCGIPEVIYCESKTIDQIQSVAQVLLDRHGLAFGTRCSAEQGRAVTQLRHDARYHEASKTIRIGREFDQRSRLCTALITAGTSDQSVAEEAAQTLETFGFPVRRIYDVGVAGLDRLLSRKDEVESADVLIVVAGMEGALPSVVGGMTKQPLIAVPTSVGYGVGIGGVVSLMAMLNSCASGVTVVNIDNGFGAAVGAIKIINLIEEQLIRRTGRSSMNNTVYETVIEEN